MSVAGHFGLGWVVKEYGGTKVTVRAACAIVLFSCSL